MKKLLAKCAATAGMTLSFLAIANSAFAGTFHKEIWVTGNSTEEKWGEIEFSWDDSAGSYLDSWSDLTSFLYTDASGNEYDLNYASNVGIYDPYYGWYNGYSYFSFDMTTQQLNAYGYRWNQPTTTGYDGFYSYNYDTSWQYTASVYKNLADSFTYLYGYDADGKANNGYQTEGHQYVYDGTSYVSYQAGYTSELRDATPVPEPASVLGLLAIGAVGAGSALKKRKSIS